VTRLIIYHICRHPQDFIIANLMLWTFAGLACL